MTTVPSTPSASSVSRALTRDTGIQASRDAPIRVRTGVDGKCPVIEVTEKFSPDRRARVAHAAELAKNLTGLGWKLTHSPRFPALIVLSTPSAKVAKTLAWNRSFGRADKGLFAG